MIDTHVHLNDERLAPRYEEIVGAFCDDGLEAVVNVGDDMPSSRLAAAQTGERVFCALGIHPSCADTMTDADYTELSALIAATPRCIAVGEIGLDYHYPEPSREAQRACFERQISLAHAHKLPIIVHVREAHGDCIEILRTHGDELHGGIIHCYSGSAESAKIYTDLGFSIAFGGAITFKNNAHAADVIRSIPRDKLLLETDCPYLTPTPYRGQTNEPKYVRYVLAKMSEILGLDEEETDRLTTANFYRTFGLKRED